ncbi:MAG: sensor histidine kinase [Spirosomataceae bacterium]
MKNTLFKHKTTLWLHVILWLAAVLLPFYVSPFYLNLPAEYLLILVWPKMITDAGIVVLFYVNYYQLTPRWISTKNTFRFWFIIILGLLVLLIFEVMYFKIIFKGDFDIGGRGVFFRGIIPMPLVLGLLFYYVIAIVVSTSMALTKHQQEQQEQQKQIEFEKLTAELEVLKLQISPHFLFNTLNNIRSLIRKKSDNAEDIVIKLSSILRYMLYQSKADTVPLRKEIQHLQDYIDLQKLRMSEPHYVRFDITGDIDKIMIEPLLFIPFVENAFKYGVHATKSAPLTFAINVIGNTLLFESSNQLFESEYEEEGSSGIGLDNVSRRLQLYYPQRHEMKIQTEEERFSVNIKIELTV